MCNNGSGKLKALGATLVSASVLATVLLIVPGTPARASGFNRQGAVNDANYWAHRTRGHPFERFGGTDCTNFVSQAWHFGGGLNMTDNWYVRDHHTWYPGDDNRDNTASWSVAVAFANYMVNARKIAHYEKNDPSNAFNSANLGDAILYNWGRGHGWSHLTIEVGWDRNGDKIDQHSTDRDHSPWNRGYTIERDPSVRKKMRDTGFFVVKVNN